MKNAKVVFDNNSSIVGENSPISPIFSSSVNKLRGFITQNNLESRVIICLTETFKQEGIAELQKRVIVAYNGTKILKDVLPQGAVKDVTEKQLGDTIQKQYEEKIKENEIQILPLPKISVAELSQRAAYYKPPFKKDDRGFKDSVAWISIIEDAENNKDTEYIIVTKDGIFSDSRLKKEFKAKTGKEITIISPDPIEETLDDVLDLGFDLEKISKEITEIVKADDTFQSKLEKNALEQLSQEGRSPYPVFVGYSSFDHNWESKIVNLVFTGVDINIKNKTDKESYEVEATVTFKPLYTKSGSSSKGGSSSFDPLRYYQGGAVTGWESPAAAAAWGHYNDEPFYPEKVKQKFTLSFSKPNKIKILNSEKMYYEPFLFGV